MKHNSLLHKDTRVASAAADENTNTAREQATNCVSLEPADKNKNTVLSGMAGGFETGNSNEKITYTILSTAIVNVQDKNNKTIAARALLDPGSQSNIMTENLCDKLGLIKRHVNYAVTGVGQEQATPAQYKVVVKISSRTFDYSKEIDCLVLDKITKPIPSLTFNPANLKIPKGTKLADPDFYEKNEIDILINATVYYSLLNMNQQKLKNGLILQNTKLGWVLSGDILLATPARQVLSHVCLDTDLNKAITKFWEVEQCDQIQRRNISAKSILREPCIGKAQVVL